LAPEQRARRPVTARSDQYSFCRSLWAAVFGAAPPDRRRRAPRSLARALEIGLSEDPSRRHASMDDLLRLLERAPLVRRRAWIAGSLLVVGLGAGAALGLGRPSAEVRCEDGRRRLAGVWDAARKDAVRRAFLATGAPFAHDAYASVERGLDAYAARWRASHVDACQATHQRGEQSPSLLDLRMACLSDRLRDARAAIDVLERIDRASLGHGTGTKHAKASPDLRVGSLSPRRRAPRGCRPRWCCPGRSCLP
jgi:hypothetical protein